MRAAQAQHGQSYLRVILRAVDITAERVDICPVLVLAKTYYKYKSFVSFIWELNDQRWSRTPD